MTRPSMLRHIRVLRRPGDPRRGLLITDGRPIPCALGRGGVTRRKREGDGATPAGVLRPVQAFYRADHGQRPRCMLPLRPIRARDGWCDDTRDRSYNRAVTLPYPAGCETMRRPDALYDIVVELDWNRKPAVRGRGSAIFLHVARDGFRPTEGCVAIRIADLRRLLPRLSGRTRFVIS